MSSDVYDFVLRGLLTEEALDRSGRLPRQLVEESLTEIASALNFDLLDADDLQASTKMASVYAAITAFERSARRFIAKVLQSEHGETWWTDCVSEKIRTF